MSSNHRFTEVTVAFNINLSTLDEARQIFEADAIRLIAQVNEHLGGTVERANSRESKSFLLWSLPEGFESKRAGHWLNFYAGTKAMLSVRPPNGKNFRNMAAQLRFVVEYDWQGSKQFMFTGYVESHNAIIANFDEDVFELLKGNARFPGSQHIKTDMTILFRLPLDAEVFDRISSLTDESVEVCTKAIEKIVKSKVAAAVAEAEDRTA